MCVLVASAAGFEFEMTEVFSIVSGTAPPQQQNEHFGCSSEEQGGGSGRCVVSEVLVQGDTTPVEIFTHTGPALTTFVLAIEGETTKTMATTTAISTNSEPSGNSNSGFFANRAAVIGTFLAVGIVVIAVIVFLLLFRYRHKARERSVPGSEDSVRPFDLKYHPPDVLPPIPESSGHNSSSFRPFDMKYEQPTIEPAGQATPSSSMRQALELSSSSAPQNPEPSPSPLSRPNSSHSTIQTTSTPTIRQMHLQQEADAFRQQVRELQQTVNASNAGVQVAMARILGHIQALEVQLNSDWARGLTDEPPPTYTSADSRTNGCEHS
ncbi:hypothetical protein D9758_013633 [Tetrapyrgos nigripes]|uniref:Uncharacterized protein n=1 Tax=Tetrapyrgos nigripes TaxID=182062 RepID=A0A8H5CPA6_9AGAR|nr:hypothetical protein D9758_013633 [Tetrapyrgos nigripes]